MTRLQLVAGVERTASLNTSERSVSCAHRARSGEQHRQASEPLTVQEHTSSSAAVPAAVETSAPVSRSAASALTSRGPLTDTRGFGHCGAATANTRTEADTSRLLPGARVSAKASVRSAVNVLPGTVSFSRPSPAAASEKPWPNAQAVTEFGLVTSTQDQRAEAASAARPAAVVLSGSQEPLPSKTRAPSTERSRSAPACKRGRYQKHRVATQARSLTICATGMDSCTTKDDDAATEPPPAEYGSVTVTRTR